MTARQSDTERSDEELLREAMTDPGSQAARAAASDLLSRYQRRVYIWCYQHVQDHERAKELAQDVMLSAYRNLKSFRGRSEFNSWLYIIARNRCISEHRRPAPIVSEHRDPDSLGSHSPDPAEAYFERLDEDTVLALIRRHLSSQEQLVMWLHCFERMPIDTITRQLEITQSTGGRGVLQTARRKLMAALARRPRA